MSTSPRSTDRRGQRSEAVWRFNAKADACGEGGSGSDITTIELWANRPGKPGRRLATDCRLDATFGDSAVFDGRHAFNNYSANVPPGHFPARLRRTDLATGEVTTAILAAPERDPSIVSIAQDGPSTYFSTNDPNPAVYQAELEFR